MDTTEVWRDIAGYEGLYSVSSLGRVHSTRSGRYLKFGAAGRGYATVSLYRGEGIDTRQVHRLVADAFLSPKPARIDTCHGNGNLRDNRASNLRYDTHNANMRDSLAHGTHHSVTQTHCAKGHEFTAENTYTQKRTSSDGGHKARRVCKMCARASTADYLLRRAS